MRKMVFLSVFLLTIACAPARIDYPTTETTITPVEISFPQKYNVHQQIMLVNDGDSSPEQQYLWVALIRSIPPYQNVISRKIFPESYTLVVDEYQNQYAEFDFSNQKTDSKVIIEIEYTLMVNELDYDFGLCEGELPDEYLSPELHIESMNPQIVSKAKELSGQKNICEKARSIYDYVCSELTYSNNRGDWGAQAALGGYMGSDCTEYSSTMIALCRAEGIPARYYEGILYRENSGTEDTPIEHAWLDIYLPGTGWTAMDPTLGRSSLNRNENFAHYSANHIIVTTGRNPSTLRGSSYWTHLYWPGNSTEIHLVNSGWDIKPVPLNN